MGRSERPTRLAEIVVGSRWRHHSTGMYEVIGLHGPDGVDLAPAHDQGFWPNPSRRVHLDYFLRNFEVV